MVSWIVASNPIPRLKWTTVLAATTTSSTPSEFTTPEILVTQTNQRKQNYHPIRKSGNGAPIARWAAKVSKTATTASISSCMRHADLGLAPMRGVGRQIRLPPGGTDWASPCGVSKIQLGLAILTLRRLRRSLSYRSSLWVSLMSPKANAAYFCRRHRSELDSDLSAVKSNVQYYYGGR